MERPQDGGVGVALFVFYISPLTKTLLENADNLYFYFSSAARYLASEPSDHTIVYRDEPRKCCAKQSLCCRVREKNGFVFFLFPLFPHFLARARTCVRAPQASRDSSAHNTIDVCTCILSSFARSRTYM